MSMRNISSEAGQATPTLSRKPRASEPPTISNESGCSPLSCPPTISTSSAVPSLDNASRQLTGTTLEESAMFTFTTARPHAASLDADAQASVDTEDASARSRSGGAVSDDDAENDSASSDAPESADYHSLSSPAIPTTSLEDVPAMLTSSYIGQAWRATPSPSSSGLGWQAEAAGATASPQHSLSTAAAAASALPAVDVVARLSGVSASPIVHASAAAAAARSWTTEARGATLEEGSRRNQHHHNSGSSISHLQPPPPSRGTLVSGPHTPDAYSRSGGGGSGESGGVGRTGAYPTAAGPTSSPPHTSTSAPSGDGRRGNSATEERRRFFCEPFKDAEPACVAPTASASDWVVLNVGGRLITTTVSTLTSDPDSVLASLCACLTRRSPAPPLRQPPLRPGGLAGPHAHRDPVGSTMKPVAASAGGGDAQSLAAEDGADAERRSTAAAINERVDGAAVQRAEPNHRHNNDDGAEPTTGDGDHSNPSPERHVSHSSRRSTAAQPLLSHQQSPQQVQQAPSASASAAAAAAAAAPTTTTATTGGVGLRDALGGEGEEGDGELVNPRHAVAAVPLDTDRYNAIMLDLDADYFLPVLNYLRHGAVMIPQHINVDGVLAMAEYLNVAGLVRRLRGPPVPRRVLLFSWGSGGNGELGTHAMRDEPTPTMAQVTPFGVRVREIALGANYSCALTDSGHVYTFGNGEWGQLGLGSGLAGGRGAFAGVGGNNNNTAHINNTGNGVGLGQDGSAADVPVELLIPRRIPLFEQLPAVHVAAGYAFAMAIVEGFHVYFWGNNNHGQSGRGRAFFDPHTKKVDTPVLVETLEGKRIIQLSCGSFFALALSEDGALYSWGLVDCVGLGTPEEVERRYHAVLGESLSNERRSVVLTPQLVTIKGRRRAGTTAATTTTTATTLASAASPNALEKIVRIRAGQWHSGAINEHGELFTWGVGYQGRLGHGSKTPAYVPILVQGALEGQRVVDVACGSFHTVALTSRGDVFCWGDNASGQCGTTANSPDAFTAPYRVVGLEYVAGGVARSIACGRQHTVVVMEGPQPWCAWPCCHVDAGGRAAHSHAQVYCFGEATRNGNGGGVGAAGTAGSVGPGRGVSGGPHGVPLTTLSASALPGSPSHTPYAAGASTAAGFVPSSLMHVFGSRPILAGTAGHHHPHYQLVSGLQHVDVRGVVSGLHHTFAFVEELMSGDAPSCTGAHAGGQSEGRYAGFGSDGARAGPWGDGEGRDYRPHYASPTSSSSGAPPLPLQPYYTASSSPAAAMHGGRLGIHGGAVLRSGHSAAATAPFHLRGLSTGPMPFYPPDWGLGVEETSNMQSSSPPPSLPPSSSTALAAGSIPNANRRFFLPS